MATAYYIGVMSGTSLDGVDLALMDFAQFPPKLTACDFSPMPEALRAALSTLVKSGECRLSQLGELDSELGELYADCIGDFLARQGLQAAQICAIGCHGQTIWHAPNGRFPFTTQIGDLHRLAAKTGITVVGDFRRKDIAYGGQGAPLVPAFHQAIFAAPDRIRAVLNIGGISNVSLLIPNQPTIGYDIGAGNTLLDLWIEQQQGKRFDHNGDWAKSGEMVPNFLNLLLDEPFLRQPPPKSTGRELFNLAWLAQKLTAYQQQFGEIRPEDVQRTLLEFTAQSIALALSEIALGDTAQDLPCDLLVCGGGAKNALLMARLQALLPNWRLGTTSDDDLGVSLDVDYVEACAFAWLAYQRLHNLPSNLPSVTGATQAVSLGAIFTP